MHKARSAVALALLAASCASPSPEPKPDSGEPSQRYIVGIAGQPVGRQQAGAGKPMTAADHGRATRDVLAAQEPTVRALGARGLAVRRRYTSALNALLVELPSSRVAEVRALPGVVAVEPAQRFTMQRDATLATLSGPEVWAGVPGITGRRARIAIMDSGIDYTHADFGGPGTVAAYQTARSGEAAPPDPSLVGCPTCKVKGGKDFVGDGYNAGAGAALPDDNPLDCWGHGTHVAGVAAGMGVTPDGATYRGPYDTSTRAQSFRIAPGMAPEADLYALRVFSCVDGAGLDVILEAYEWLLDPANPRMDVVNMSWGGPMFARPDDLALQATRTLVDAGIVVVTSAGNNNGVSYAMGVPAATEGALAVGATYAHARLPAYRVNGMLMQSRNGLSFAQGASLPLIVLRNESGAPGGGCTASAFDAVPVAGRIVVRSDEGGPFSPCFRAAAQLASDRGAAGLLTLTTGTAVAENLSNAYGWHFARVPVGVVLARDVAAVLAADGTSVTVGNDEIVHPSTGTFATFTSGGLRYGDNLFKPDVAAPGAQIVSGMVGSGGGTALFGGTSDAAPVVSGLAALLVERRPDLTPADLVAAIASTGDPAPIGGPSYFPRRSGSGLAQPLRAATTQLVARAADGASGVSFGVVESTVDIERTRHLVVKNVGSQSVEVTLAVTAAGAAVVPHTATVGDPSVTIAPGTTARIPLTVSVPIATVGSSAGLRQVGGYVTLTPSSGPPLHVPYMMMVRARADVEAELDGRTLTLANHAAVVPATAELYSWGLEGAGDDPRAVRAVGVRAFDAGGVRRVSFAVTMAQRWSHFGRLEVDIAVRSAAGTIKVIAGDLSSAACAAVNGATRTPGTLIAQLDSATLICTLRASDLGLGPEQPRFTYTALVKDSPAAGGLLDPGIAVPGEGSFNAFAPALSDSAGGAVTLAPGAGAQVTLDTRASEWAVTPPLGLMTVVIDNDSARQAHVNKMHVNVDRGSRR